MQGDLQRCLATVGEADDDWLLQSQRVSQGSDIVRHLAKGEVARRVGGPAVTPGVGGNKSPAFRQRCERNVPGDVGGRGASMEQQHRGPTAQFEIVDVQVTCGHGPRLRFSHRRSPSSHADMSVHQRPSSQDPGRKISPVRCERCIADRSATDDRGVGPRATPIRPDSASERVTACGRRCVGCSDADVARWGNVVPEPHASWPDQRFTFESGQELV